MFLILSVALRLIVARCSCVAHFPLIPFISLCPFFVQFAFSSFSSSLIRLTDSHFLTLPSSTPPFIIILPYTSFL